MFGELSKYTKWSLMTGWSLMTVFYLYLVNKSNAVLPPVGLLLALCESEVRGMTPVFFVPFLFLLFGDHELVDWLMADQCFWTPFAAATTLDFSCGSTFHFSGRHLLSTCS